MTKHVILVTGASSGFGLMTARALAQAGHIVYASMRETQGRNAPQVAAVVHWAAGRRADLRTVELDVQSDASSEAAIALILANAGRLDVIVHNAGHLMFGPAEAFTPDQYIQQYDVNVLGAQRVNPRRAARSCGASRARACWSGSAHPRRAAARRRFLAPYFAAKAAMDALAGLLFHRACAMGHRDHDHGAGCLHQGDQPLRPFRRSGGHHARRRI